MQPYPFCPGFVGSGKGGGFEIVDHHFTVGLDFGSSEGIVQKHQGFAQVNGRSQLPGKLVAVAGGGRAEMIVIYKGHCTVDIRHSSAFPYKEQPGVQ